MSPAWYSKKPRRSGPMGYLAPHACGTSISMAWWRSRPPVVSNSRALSRQAESLPRLVDHRQQLGHVVAEELGLGSRSRERIQFMLPRRVLISPLCAR